MEYILIIVGLFVFIWIKDLLTRPFKDKKSSSIHNAEYKSSYSSYDTNDYEDDDDKKDYLEVHTSETGLANKLLRDTGSKRMAKDILVEEYGYSQPEAKSLAGYRGY